MGQVLASCAFRHHSYNRDGAWTVHSGDQTDPVFVLMDEEGEMGPKQISSQKYNCQQWKCSRRKK